MSFFFTLLLIGLSEFSVFCVGVWEEGCMRTWKIEKGKERASQRRRYNWKVPNCLLIGRWQNSMHVICVYVCVSVRCSFFLVCFLRFGVLVAIIKMCCNVSIGSQLSSSRSLYVVSELHQDCQKRLAGMLLKRHNHPSKPHTELRESTLKNYSTYSNE